MENKDKKYRIIAKNILKRILSDKNLKDNDSFDSEYALSVQYKTTRVTVRKAVEFLLNANVLYKIPRKGVFIKSILAAELFARQLEQHGNSLLNNVTISNQKEKIIVFANPCYEINFSNMEMEQSTPFAYELCRAFRKYIQAYPCSLTVINATSAQELLEEKNLKKLREFGLLYIAPYNRDQQVIEQLIAEGVKVLLLAVGPWPDNFSYVSSDQFGAGKILGDYLFKLGHERVCFFHRPYSNTAMARLDGLVESASQHHIRRDKFCFIDMNEDTFTKLKEHVTGPNRSTAIVANNPKEYFRILRLVNECGLRVPEDISVCTFGDTDFLCFQEIPVTAVQQCVEEIVFLAIDKLLSLKNNREKAPIVDTSSKSRLIVRDSVAEPPQCYARRKKVAAG